MCHRIRQAMQDKGFFQLLSGMVEADETYVGGKTLRGSKAWREQVQDEIQMGLREKPVRWKKDKANVFGMVERSGKAKTMVVPDDKGTTLKPITTKMINLKDATLMTDGHRAYIGIKEHLPHYVINYKIAYVDGNVHTQNIESYWSLLKQGVIGAFHHIGDGYLPQYLHEFGYRFNRRKMNDAERFSACRLSSRSLLLPTSPSYAYSAFTPCP